MINLTFDQFKQTAVYQNKTEVLYKNHLYSKKISCSVQQKEKVIKYCKLQQSKNLLTLIVEQHGLLTVWLQKVKSNLVVNNTEATINVKELVEVQNATSKETQNTTETFSQTKPQSKPTPTEVAKTKKVIRKYRGQTYEVEIPIVEKQTSKPQQKYRGQPY